MNRFHKYLLQFIINLLVFDNTYYIGLTFIIYFSNIFYHIQIMLIKKLFKTLFCIFISIQITFSQNTSLGIFEDHCDIGNVKNNGSVIYNPDNQEYIIEGSGSNMWFDQDEFHFLWKLMNGDFLLTAKIEFVGSGVELHRKTGWIIRDSLSTSSPHVSAVVHGDGLTSLQFRRTAGVETEEVRSEDQGPEIIHLERKGKTFTMSTSHNGDTFISVQIDDIKLEDEVYVGLFICSHNAEITEKAIFRDVSIIQREK